MTVGDLLRTLTTRFAAAGIDSARIDARVLLAHVLGVEPLQLFNRPERVLTPPELEQAEALARRREAREPMAHITGRRGFWTIELEVTADTLDPRPDTETLVEAVLAALPDRQAPLSLVDFGTGTGCILLALLSELPRATGLGIDISPGALAVAERNARRLGLAERAGFKLGDWGRGLAGRIDVITSNPPYIPESDLAALEPEVARWEPRTALTAGPDGLEAYRILAPQMAELLAPGGLAAVEVGKGQAPEVAALMGAAGLVAVETRPDLAGVERCVLARKAAKMT